MLFRSAREIAQGWNVKYNQDHRGYVTRFEIDDEYFGRFEVHRVGKLYHEELWVPAKEPDMSRMYVHRA